MESTLDVLPDNKTANPKRFKRGPNGLRQPIVLHRRWGPPLGETISSHGRLLAASPTFWITMEGGGKKKIIPSTNFCHEIGQVA